MCWIDSGLAGNTAKSEEISPFNVNVILKLFVNYYKCVCAQIASYIKINETFTVEEISL